MHQKRNIPKFLLYGLEQSLNLIVVSGVAGENNGLF